MVRQKFSMLTCPDCDRSVIFRDGYLYCKICSEKIQIVKDIPRFPVELNKDSSVKFFDFISSIYETSIWFPVVYRFISGSLNPLDDRRYLYELVDFEDKNVLDIACGTGRFTRYIAEESEYVVGIDISEKMLEKAKKYIDQKNIKNILFAKMDAYNLNLKNNFFDLVSCCWALHLFPDFTKTLKEIYRVLTPKGQFIGTTLINRYIFDLPYIKKWFKQTFELYVFEKEELKNLLLETGFKDIYMKEKGATVFFRCKK